MKTRLPAPKSSIALVKKMLWEGKGQERVAFITGHDQSTVSRIRTGQMHSDVPWPNGKTGAMPVEMDRGGGDEHAPWSHDATVFQAFPAEMQNRILDLVNTRRQEVGLEPIPDVDPTYGSYLISEDVEDESAALYEARDYEDARIRQVMTEFREISEREIATKRAEDLLLALSTTSHFGTNDESEQATPAATGELLYDKLPWDSLTRYTTEIPIIAEAEKGDEYLKEATCIVFYTLQNTPKTIWKEPKIAREIFRIAERLRRRAGKADEL